VGVTNGTVLPVITQGEVERRLALHLRLHNSLQVSVVRKYFDTVGAQCDELHLRCTGRRCAASHRSSVSAQNWTGLNSVPASVTDTVQRGWRRCVCADCA
jgi:hypothetical protein